MQAVQGALGAVDGGLGAVDGMIGQFIDGKDPEAVDSHTMDIYAPINRANQMHVKEKMSVLEAASVLLPGYDHEIEMPNKYTVTADDGKTPIYFALEGTDICTRNCKMLNDCAAFNVDLRVINNEGQSEQAFMLNREWQATCCCFNRPTLHITEAQSGKAIADLQDPWACCDITFKIKDPNTGDDEMYIKGGCCQPGLCCPLPCGPCSEVNFNIEDATGTEVGHIQKKVPSFLKFLAAPDVDNYDIDVSGIEDPKMKVAVMATAIFIDFRYFNENDNNERQEQMNDMFSDSD
eukprot:TRINITY_DN9811_c0_g1_i2.p1 TRINITY_DN9811_c0_g1~~TRINITY_DN9811_c0_g1_i2.p1  ORF type:complete len:292 (-),score=90.42 TRINITY_DN9811_c0_g1_i2:319-1194(-)